MDDTFLMASTSSIIVQRLGKTVQRAPAVVVCLPAGCHGNLTVLNLLSASVAKNQHFRPCRKNYALDRKMIHTF